MPIAKCRFETQVYRLRFFNSAISNQQSAIGNQQSAIGNQQSEISLQASAAGTVLREKLELTGDRGV